MTSHDITAPWDRLFLEARENADTYLRDALYATKELPDGVDRTAVIVAHMRAAQGEFATSARGVAAQRVSEALADIGVALRDTIA